jgi:DNA-binding HxlR family transcriptional regulator
VTSQPGHDQPTAESGLDSSPLAEALARVGDRWTLLVVEALGNHEPRQAQVHYV